MKRSPWSKSNIPLYTTLGSDPMKKKWFFSKETINENESIGYWRCSNNHIKFCGRRIGALQGMERKTMKTTLLIMAVGIGSRFGTGIKQLEPVDYGSFTRVRPYEVRIKWINASLKFSKEIIKVILINISKLRLLFTVSSIWWNIPDRSIVL